MRRYTANVIFSYTVDFEVDAESEGEAEDALRRYLRNMSPLPNTEVRRLDPPCDRGESNLDSIIIY